MPADQQRSTNSDGFRSYRLFGRSHLRRSIPVSKVWHRIVDFKGEKCGMTNGGESICQMASDTPQSRLVTLNF